MLRTAVTPCAVFSSSLGRTITGSWLASPLPAGCICSRRTARPRGSHFFLPPLHMKHAICHAGSQWHLVDTVPPWASSFRGSLLLSPVNLWWAGGEEEFFWHCWWRGRMILMTLCDLTGAAAHWTLCSLTCGFWWRVYILGLASSSVWQMMKINKCDSN